MKKQVFKVFGLLTILAFVAYSCEKEAPIDNLEDSGDISDDIAQEEHGNWETTDPAAIADYESNMLTAKGDIKLAAKDRTIKYKGVRILVSDKTPKDIISLIKGEIDRTLKSSVKWDWKKKRLDAFVDSRKSDGRLFYTSEAKAIVIFDWPKYRKIAGKKTGNVFFHELVHHWHRIHFSKNLNTTNENNYNNAVKKKLYPKGEYVLKNEFEYLAVSTESFYFGRNGAPKNRKVLKNKDKAEFNFIKNNINK